MYLSFTATNVSPLSWRAWHLDNLMGHGKLLPPRPLWFFLLFFDPLLTSHILCTENISLLFNFYFKAFFHLKKKSALASVDCDTKLNFFKNVCHVICRFRALTIMACLRFFLNFDFLFLYCCCPKYRIYKFSSPRPDASAGLANLMYHTSLHAVNAFFQWYTAVMAFCYESVACWTVCCSIIVLYTTGSSLGNKKSHGRKTVTLLFIWCPFGKEWKKRNLYIIVHFVSYYFKVDFGIVLIFDVFLFFALVAETRLLLSL